MTKYGGGVSSFIPIKFSNNCFQNNIFGNLPNIKVVIVVVLPIPLDEMPIDKWFISCVSVAQSITSSWSISNRNLYV